VLLDVRTGVVYLLNRKVCSADTNVGENVCGCLLVFFLDDKKKCFIFALAEKENGFSEQR
jgi:hypothetical protein